MITRLLLGGLRLALLMLAVSFTGFALVEAGAGDPAQAQLGRQASAADLQALRSTLGLDRPLALRYLDHLRQLLRGELGQSLVDGAPIAARLAEAGRVTASLVLPGFGLGLLLTLGLAGLALRHPGGWLDRGCGLLSAAALGLGAVLLALGAQWLLCSPAGLDACPVRGWSLQSSAEYLRHLPAPLLALALSVFAAQWPACRALLAEALAAPWQTGLQARGCGYGRRLWQHTLPALAPALTARLLYSLPPWLVGASLLFEQAYAVPGLGLTLQQALAASDQPLLLALITLTALGYAALQALAGALAGPRVSTLTPSWAG